MTHSITTVTPDNVPQLTYDGKAVVTTAMLAQLYGTDEVRIRQNYTKNKARFVHGKHCFKVEGNELKDLKNRVSQSYSVGIGSNARSVVLYTERGAARHAKMLETNAAWDVFEALEDNYFGKFEPKANNLALPNPLTPAHQRGIQKAIARRAQALPKPAQRTVYSRIYSHLKDRFEVGSYKDIDESRYTEALAAVESVSLEGEYLSGSMPAESLTINAPASKRWSDYTVGELMGEDTMYGETNRMIRTLEKAAETGAPVYVSDMGAIEQEILALRHIAETTMHRQHMLTSNLLSTNCHAEAVERTWVSTIGPAVSMFDRVLAANMREHIGVIRRLTGHALSRHSLPEAI